MFVGIAIFLGLSTQNIEAAVINRRLKKVADAESPPDESKVADLVRALKYIRDDRIKVDPKILASVGKVIDNPATPQYIQAATLIADVQSSLQRHPVPSNLRPALFKDLLENKYNIFVGIKFGRIAVSLDTNGFESCYFEGCHIVYRGGATILSDDLFIGCTFEIMDTPLGRRLASILTETNAVTAFEYKPEEILPKR